MSTLDELMHKKLIREITRVCECACNDSAVGTPLNSASLNDVLEAAKKLDQLVPMPWHIREDDLSGYMCDAEGCMMFGGENSEGRVSSGEPVMQILIELTQALAKILHRE